MMSGAAKTLQPPSQLRVRRNRNSRNKLGAFSKQQSVTSNSSRSTNSCDSQQSIWLEKTTAQILACKPGELSMSLYNQTRPLLKAWGAKATVQSRCVNGTAGEESGAEMANKILERIIVEEDYDHQEHQQSLMMLSLDLSSISLDEGFSLSSRPMCDSSSYCSGGSSSSVTDQTALMDESFATLYSSDNSFLSPRKSPVSTSNKQRIPIIATTAMYCSVIDAFAKAGEPQKAEALLKKMHDRAGSSSVAAQPNTVAFNAVLDAWSRMNCRDHTEAVAAAERAEAILNWMHMLADQQRMVEPDVISYNSVLVAWGKCGEPSRAEALHNCMEKLHEETGKLSLKPNTHTFTTIIHGWAKSAQPGAAFRAQDILERMERKFLETNDENVRPNVRTFTAVIDAFAKSNEDNAPQKAEHILTRMETHSRAGRTDMSPNTLTYAAVLDVFAKSKKAGKAWHARCILDRMEKQYLEGNEQVKPNVFVFTAVINACAFSNCVGGQEEKSQAMSIALNTMSYLHQSDYGHPNHVTYTTLLKAVFNLMPKGQEQAHLAQRIFDECRDNGQVSKNAVAQYRKIMSRSASSFSIGDNIPVHWSRNVHEKTYYKKVQKPRA